MEHQPDVLATTLRTAISSALLVGGIAVLRRRGGAAPLATASWALLVAVLVSAALGIDYTLFQLPPALAQARSAGSFTVHHTYGLTAAVIFVVAQLVAAFHLARGDARYRDWLLPALAYLFFIGLFGALGFGIVLALFADTGRAVLLLALVVAHERSIAG